MSGLGLGGGFRRPDLPEPNERYKKVAGPGHIQAPIIPTPNTNKNNEANEADDCLRTASIGSGNSTGTGSRYRRGASVPANNDKEDQKPTNKHVATYRIQAADPLLLSFKLPREQKVFTNGTYLNSNNGQLERLVEAKGNPYFFDDSKSDRMMIYSGASKQYYELARGFVNWVLTDPELRRDLSVLKVSDINQRYDGQDTTGKRFCNPLDAIVFLVKSVAEKNKTYDDDTSLTTAQNLRKQLEPYLTA